MQDSGKLVLYLRDINLPKVDKYGTSQVMAFLQQLLTYQGFYDNKLEFVGELVIHLHLPFAGTRGYMRPMGPCAGFAVLCKA